MRVVLFLLLPLLLFPTPFKVATYNVENLFDAQYVGTEYKDYTKKHNWTKRMVEIKLNHVAEVICDLDAEILALQEIENDNIFKQLQKRLSRVGCGYRYAAITSKKDAPIQVALLSRFPIKKQRELQVSYAPRVRNILEVEVDVGGEGFTLFVNHWKSRAYHGLESKRMKYAKTLQSRLQKFPKLKSYIILGDFNTDYDAHLSLEKKLDDTHGKTGLHHVLGVEKNGHLVTEFDMLRHGDGYHYTLWKELSLQKRWNTKFYGKKGTADHILLPANMFDKKGIDYVNNSFGIFKKSYLFTKRGYINRWQYKKGKHRGKGYSDHLPIYAYFDTKPYHAGRDSIEMQTTREVKSIEYLYTQEALENEVILEDAVVIWKHKRNAVIKHSKEGRGIFLFGCAAKLEVGKRYHLLARAMKEYKGLKELTHVYVLKDKGREDVSKYLLRASDLSKKISYRQNEVVTDLVGIYKNKHFYIEDRKIPIYFKKKKSTPSNGSKLKIHNALLGYYKKLQLVVSSPKDFTVLE
ncbi:MAG: hypothetical protein COA92_04460 [Sulfurovum sp.]|nr:MAG: hypothetical protein COA92_04460 [Sulfurovum sp.]